MEEKYKNEKCYELEGNIKQQLLRLLESKEKELKKIDNEINGLHCIDQTNTNCYKIPCGIIGCYNRDKCFLDKTKCYHKIIEKQRIQKEILKINKEMNKEIKQERKIIENNYLDDDDDKELIPWKDKEKGILQFDGDIHDTYVSDPVLLKRLQLYSDQNQKVNLKNLKKTILEHNKHQFTPPEEKKKKKKTEQEKEKQTRKTKKVHFSSL
jgi:hypothetical protein